MPEQPGAPYQDVVKAIFDGRLVPFLGSGANRCGRAQEFQPGENLPDGGELAEYLAREFEYAGSDKRDLARVSQYVAIRHGYGPLFAKIHGLLDCDLPCTPLHALLAGLPKALRQAGRPPHQLIVTTNYDDLMERAFKDAGEEFDVVAYVAVGDTRGRFHHQQGDGTWKPIDVPNKYLDVSLDRRSVVLKIHGAVDRVDRERDGFVITEDHYIEYLTRTDISGLVPSLLVAKLKRSNFLFLGYSLRDWNLRVILHRIWGEQRLSYTSWAIQKDGDSLDQKLWGLRGVDIFYLDLGDYVAGLAAGLEKAVRKEGGGPGPAAAP